MSSRLSSFLVGVSLVALLVSAVSARDTGRPERRLTRPWSSDEFGDPMLFDEGVRDRYTAAQADTYCLIWYDFEQMAWQGWVQKDMTAQEDTFVHMDDFSGLGGGSYGKLHPIEGTMSMWCGARDVDHQITGCPGLYEYLCSWIDAPGYGNAWDQRLMTGPISFQGLLTFSYHGYFDSEPDYDETHVEYDAGGGNWVEIAKYDDAMDTVAVHELFLVQAQTKLRFRFTSDGAWSDQDGLWNTDGAFIVDSITVSDIGGEIDYEDFEYWGDVCGTDTRPHGGIWYGVPAEGYGINSGLTPNLADKDPCGDNFGTQVVFFFSPGPHPSPDYPGLFETPYCTGPGGIEAPCQNEIIMSPLIDMEMYSSNCDEVQDTPIPPAVLPDLGGAVLRFTVYRDLPVVNCVFYVWSVRSIAAGCPGQWQDRGYVYYGPDMDYIQSSFDVSDLVGMDNDGDGHTDPIQIILGCVDMCDVWYEVYCNCANHTPSPWFDNARFYRYSTSGPQWSYRHLDIFQDNFPGVEFNLESYVRADCANDLRPCDDPVIDPGDSAVVTCNSPLGGGIDTTLDGWPKVYCHVKCDFVGPMIPPHGPKPDLYGPSLEGTYGRYDSDDGSTWTILQCDYARTSAGSMSPNRYMVDMNDSLFTRGYMISYYFEAYDFAGESSTLPTDAGEGVYFEWTCLPSMKTITLYVDDFHGRGNIDGYVQVYWDQSFRSVISDENYPPDRYDVNNPSSLVSNGPGSRAKNFHMTSAYYHVIWDSGNLDVGTISDGSCNRDKSNDCQMLIDWMEFSAHDVALWICGDDVASDLDELTSAQAIALMTSYCGVDFVHDSYFDLTGGRLIGGIVTPKVEAVPDPNNPLWHTTWGDSFYVFGGCPIINQFDVLENAGNGEYALRYPDYGGLPYYAGIYNNGINNGGYDIRTLWFGFSFMYMRECEITEPMMRYQVVRDFFTWSEHSGIKSDITEVEDVPAVNALSQNFPNPFNPTTTIHFGLRMKGHVSIRIFDVAGRLVRTLADEVRDAGPHSVTWNGKNNLGNKVASGVYLYKMNTAEFERTRKMVLLR